MTSTRPWAPAGPTRNPVMTSSKTSSAPVSSQRRRSAGEEPGVGGDEPHVRGDRLDEDGRDVGAVLGEHGVEGVVVVERDDDRVGDGAGGDPGGAGQPEGRDAAAGRDEEGVEVPVVAAGELHDLGPAGRAAGEPHGGHRRLGAGRDEAQLLDGRDPLGDGLGELDLPGGGGAEGGAGRRGALHRLDDRRVGVAEDRRAPRLDVVEVAAPVGVDEVRALAAGDEERVAADAGEGPDRRVHPAGDAGPGAGPQRVAHRRASAIRRAA